MDELDEYCKKEGSCLMAKNSSDEENTQRMQVHNQKRDRDQATTAAFHSSTPARALKKN